MGVGGQRYTPAALPPGKTRYPLYRRLGVSQGRSWTGTENLASTGIRSPDRPARSESLYRLSYPGPESVHTNTGKGNKENTYARRCISIFVPVTHLCASGYTNRVNLARVIVAWHIRALGVKETTRRLGAAGWSCSWCAVREIIYRRYK